MRKTTSSKDVIVKMKKLGYRSLEPNRGLQVKQTILCLTHSEEFQSYPHLILKGSKVLECVSCAKEYIKSGDASGINLWKRPELFKYTLTTCGKYPHSLVRVDEGKKELVMYCELSKKTFTVKSWLSECRQGKTTCEFCAEKVAEARSRKIRAAATAYFNKHYATDTVYYDLAGKHCVKHGRIKGSRCLVCRPQQIASPIKWNSAEVKDKIAILARKNGFKYRYNSELNVIELLVCREHACVVESRKPNAWRTLAWAKCAECEAQKVLSDIADKWPNMKVREIQPVTKSAWVTWLGMTDSGIRFRYNATLKEMRSKTKPRLGATQKYLREDFNMANRLTQNQILHRISVTFPEVEVLKYKEITREESPTVSRLTLKLRLHCNMCDISWTTTSVRLMQTKYGCPSCAKKNIGLSISDGLASLESYNKTLNERVPYLTVIEKLKYTRPDSGYKFRLKVSCSRCNETYVLAPSCAKNLTDCFSCGKASSKRGGRSPIANNWLTELEGIYGIKIQGCSTKEATLRKGDRIFRVDGFHKESNTVFEFLGDYWHGNPETYPDKKEAYVSTIERLTTLSQRYNVLYIWESDYKLLGLHFSGVLGRGLISFLS